MDQLIGKAVFVRTVTNYYTGTLLAFEGGFLHLADAAWIAHTGRFSDALAEGTLSEIEPYPADCWVAAGAVVDISLWQHALPRTQK